MAWRSKIVVGRTWSVFLIAARKRSSSGDKSPRLPIAFLKRGLPLMMMTTETKGGTFANFARRVIAVCELRDPLKVRI